MKIKISAFSPITGNKINSRTIELKEVATVYEHTIGFTESNRSDRVRVRNLKDRWDKAYGAILTYKVEAV